MNAGVMTAKLFSSRKDQSSESACQGENADNSFSSSIQRLEAILISHASDCNHCLEMVLFREETLAEVGCDEYKRLLAGVNSVLLFLATAQPDLHINEHVLGEYCANLLPEAINRAVEEHAKICSFCADRLVGRFTHVIQKQRDLDHF